MIYYEFRTWRKALEYRGGMILKGLYGLFFHCLIMGTVSLLYFVIRQVNAFYRRETIAGCIITLLLFFLSIGWLASFVNERYQRNEAQYKADSLSYELSKFTQMYDTAGANEFNENP